jgi:hypothetical protein
MFIAALSTKLPIWAERQRSNARSKSGKLSLDDLIADITDEARNKETGGSSGGSSAMFSGKTRGLSKKDRKASTTKGGGEKSAFPKVCKHCNEKSPHHAPDNCFEVNFEKRKAFEERTGKKWVSRRKENKQGKDDEEDHFVMQSNSNRRVGFSIPMSYAQQQEYHLLPMQKLPWSQRHFMPQNAIPEVEEINNPSAYSAVTRNMWLYDTGASDHLANSLSQFVEYTPIDDLPSFSTANGNLTPRGIGKVILSCPTENGKIKKIELNDVYYMPECGCNLFSGKRFMQRGGTVSGKKRWNLQSPLVNGTRRLLCYIDWNLFIVTDQTHLSMPAAIQEAAIDIDLWHRRLGHMSLDNVKLTQKMTKGLQYKQQTTIPNVSITCDPCEKGKPYRGTRKHANPRIYEIKAAECWHIDVFLISPLGLNGEKYGMIVTCERTGMKFFHTFTKKNEAFVKIKDHLAYIKTHFKTTPKFFRLDGGKEYVPSQLEQLANDIGSEVETTTARTPNQDGKSERAIRTILERARCAMIDQGIPQFLWPEIISATVHVTNRSATSTLGGVTPFQAFLDSIWPETRHIPSVAHIRVLGCKAYVHIPKEDRVISEKLVPRAEVGILVGYEGSSIYRIYMPPKLGRGKGRIVRTSHVRFDESGIITDGEEWNAVHSHPADISSKGVASRAPASTPESGQEGQAESAPEPDQLPASIETDTDQQPLNLDPSGFSPPGWGNTIEEDDNNFEDAPGEQECFPPDQDQEIFDLAEVVKVKLLSSFNR